MDAKCVTQIVGRGMGGIQGPPYMGTGCFHRRKLIYAFSLDDTDIKGLFSLSLLFRLCAVFESENQVAHKMAGHKNYYK